MNEFLLRNKAIIIIFVLIAGLFASVYLVQKQQLLKSKATDEINTVINVSGDQRKEVNYQGNKTFKTTSKKINIELDPAKLEDWIKSQQ